MTRAAVKPLPASVEAFSPDQVDQWLGAIPGFVEMLGSWRLWSGKVTETPSELRAFVRWLSSSKTPDGWKDRVLTKGTVLVRSEHPFFKKTESRNSSDLWRCIAEVMADCYSPENAAQVLGSGKDPASYTPEIYIQPLIVAEFSGRCLTRSGWKAQPETTFAVGNMERFLIAEDELKRATPPAADYPFSETLWKIAEAFELETKHPVSFDWSWSPEGKLHILSPLKKITTPEAEITALSLQYNRKWDREMAQERYPEHITLLGWTAIEDLIPSNLDGLVKDFGILTDRSTPMALRYRGIVYSDSQFFKYPGRAKFTLGKYFNPFTIQGSQIYYAIFSYLFRLSPFRDQKISRAFLKLDLIEAILLTKTNRVAAAWENHIEQSRAALQILNAEIDDLGSTPHDTLQSMEKLRAISIDFLKPDLSIYVIKDTFNKALQGLWRAIGAKESELYQILSSFDHNQSLEMGEDWQNLVTALKRDPAAGDFIESLVLGADTSGRLAPSAQSAWRFFLDRNGHTRTDWDIARPSWRESPALMAPLLQSMMKENEKKYAFKTNNAENIVRFQYILKCAGLTDEEVKKQNERLSLIQNYMRMDEELRFFSGLLLEPSRKLVLKAGLQLKECDVLEDEKDVFFLSLSELKKSLGDQTLSRIALVKKRKEDQATDLLHPIATEVPVENKKSAVQITDGNEWKGIPASPGKAKGPAFFLEHLEQATHLPDGAILFTTSPNPAFVPLYPVLGALITKTGGALSHGFVAAREFQLPAISGFDWSSGFIQKGEVLEIDGASGTIKRVP